MKNSRPGFMFKIAIAAIIVISITIVTLIIMLTTIDNENPYVINEEAAKEKEIVIHKEESTSYLDKMERYKDVARAERPKVNVEDEDTASLVSQNSEESKNSTSTLIDAIVAKSQKKTPEPVAVPETVPETEPETVTESEAATEATPAQE